MEKSWNYKQSNVYEIGELNLFDGKYALYELNE